MPVKHTWTGKFNCPRHTAQLVPRSGKTHRGIFRLMWRGAIWGERWDSNPRQPESQSGALPTELRPPWSFYTAPGHVFPGQSACAGAPGRIRTCYPRLRRPMLYPDELRAHAWMPPSPARRRRAAHGASFACIERRHRGSVNGIEVVGVEGFEPPTSSSQSWRATRLRYTPLASPPLAHRRSALVSREGMIRPSSGGVKPCPCHPGPCHPGPCHPVTMSRARQ